MLVNPGATTAADSQFKNVLNNTYFKCAALVVAGILGLFALAPYNYFICTIIQLLILFWVINNLSPALTKWNIFSYGLIYGYAYFAIQIYWIFYFLYFVIHAGFWITFLAILCFPLYLGLYPAFAILTYIKLKSKSALYNQLILFPSLWVIFEWLRGWLLGGYPWSDIGYSALDLYSLRSYFTLIGEYGVSWLCVSLIGVFYLMINRSVTSKKQNRLAVIYLALIMLTGYALQPVQFTKPYGKPVSVALIQGNIGEGTKWTEAGNSLKIYAEIVKKTKADIVMMPETGISIFENNLPKGYLDTLESYAKTNGADLVVGLPKIIDKENNYINAAMVLTAPKRPYYTKSHLVPFGEYIPFRWLLGPLYNFIALPMVGFTPGAEYQPPLVVGNQKLAFNICFENGFGSELIRSASVSTLMVNLSDMVWYGKTIAMDQHLQLSRARALENQRYFIQETNTSITAVISPDGVIQSQLPVFKREVLNDYVTGRIGVTPFEIYGNWLIILLCLISIVFSLAYRFKYWKKDTD